jgi:hypothetical protein
MSDEQLINKEITNTTRWGVGLLIGLLIQTAGMVWWAAQLDAQVESNTADIQSLDTKLDNSAAVTISREQIEDLLGARDQRLKNVEDTTQRIERKLDLLLN